MEVNCKTCQYEHKGHCRLYDRKAIAACCLWMPIFDKGLKSNPKKYDHIDFSPPQGVRKAVRRGIEQAENGLAGDGLESATVREARAIARGENVTPAKVRKGHRFWGRNERFLDEETDSPADVSANLWGGRPGVSWFRKLFEQMEAADKKD